MRIIVGFVLAGIGLAAFGCGNAGPANGATAASNTPIAPGAAAGANLVAAPAYVPIGKVIGSIDFVEIPSTGDFQIGSPDGELGREARSERQQKVKIKKSFWLARREITVEQYWRVVDSKHVVAASEKSLPMTKISWDQAVKFCELLQQEQPQHKFRLPREAEWEFAARGGAGAQSTPFSFWNPTLQEALECWHKYNDKGKLPRTLNRYLNYESASVKPVGSYPNVATPFGLQDMHGNVHEWCGLPEANEPEIVGSLSNRPIRGGSWVSSFMKCRSASRAFQSKDSGRDSIGFRVLMEN